MICRRSTSPLPALMRAKACSLEVVMCTKSRFSAERPYTSMPSIDGRQVVWYPTCDVDRCGYEQKAICGSRKPPEWPCLALIFSISAEISRRPPPYNTNACTHGVSIALHVLKCVVFFAQHARHDALAQLRVAMQTVPAHNAHVCMFFVYMNALLDQLLRHAERQPQRGKRHEAAAACSAPAPKRVAQLIREPPR